MDMPVFVKKLVEKASLKKPAGLSDNLKPDEVNPHLVFHYGIPSGSIMLAYDSIQQILAISTKDGQIKLFGKCGSQAILESPETAPSKFLLFVKNQGILLNVNANNHIEVWDIDRKHLSAVHHYEKDIASFVAMHNAPYLYVGDSSGNVSILRLHQEQHTIEQMKYQIPLSASHGKSSEAENDVMVKFILCHPTAESKRALIIFSDGGITLWSIRESKAIFTTCGSTTVQLIHQDAKKVTAACWACPVGTKVAVGYSNGDITVWSIPSYQNELSSSQITPAYKLNLGYKAEKIPISKMKWIDSDGKSSRLYVLGWSDSTTNTVQVVLLNEQTETRTIKLGLQPPEPLIDFEIATSSIEQNKNRCDPLLLLGRSGHVYAYDVYSIERYLTQSQNKSSPSLPKESLIKLPYCDSSITVAKFITGVPCLLCSAEEDINMLEKNSLPLFPFERSVKDGSNSFSSFSKAQNLFITGHSSGAVNFWDASRPLFLPLVSVTQQSDNDFSLSGIPVTALYYSIDSHVLVSGDQNGTVRVYTFKPELFAPQNNFLSFQGSSKKSSQYVRRVKVIKVNGAVLSINATENMKQLAIGSDQGYVTLIDPEGPNVLYTRQIASEFSTGIISMNFGTCSFHGFEKNVMIVATKDSSVLTYEKDSGTTLSTGVVRPKKPSRALFMQILANSADSADSYLLLCSEKAIYAFSLPHLVQGVKKAHYKKKFNSPCYWASTFGSPDVGLIILFATGKIEIRSLPDLSLLKESSVRALTFSSSRLSSMSDIIVSSSHDGELIIVKGDHELVLVSTFLHKEAYRCLDSGTRVLHKELVNAQALVSSPVKEKKKGMFGSVIKESKSTKPKSRLEVETEDSRESIEELWTVFSAANFQNLNDTESEENIDTNKAVVDLDIDDIDIDDLKEKPRGNPVIAGFNKNITNKFQAIKGKLIHAKVKNDKVAVNNEPHEEKTGAVDQIKKKYGYAMSSDTSAANAAKTKLSENLNKLQGISMKTTEMQDTARSFSSMAKQVLRFSETSSSKKE
ncbi:uncharacterized protein LOC127258338 isoform X2 [Andrographis paniculata]|uniref:uncharacterized protein LOC127258338 isoform X2 n=1 Tax=Andrographis paniculata TaxID=175694 RepID=UPI0021E977D6|nr:uncharacterized protein LOC127258338 isoform X2 [Andrographis paniculata]